MSPSVIKQANFKKLLNARVNECLSEINSMYGNILEIPNISQLIMNYEFMHPKWAAHATVDTRGKYEKCILSINPKLIEGNEREYINNVIPHELSHIICMKNELDFEHGKYWKAICRTMGGNGNKYANV